MDQEYRAYPLVDALLRRRSRRFCLGMTLHNGPLSFASRHGPTPLSESDEALMAFSACGLTGHALGDLEYGKGSGGQILAGAVGRTIPSGDAIHSVSLITVSDAGAFLYRRPQELSPTAVREIVRLNQQKEFVEAARRMRVPLEDQRVRTPSQPVYNIDANRWSAHAPGTTCFLPVNELTFLYINGLLEFLNESAGVFIVDERASFRPAGLAKFAKSKGGHLSDDPKEQKVITTAIVERLVTEFTTAEQGMMTQNLALMGQALGLGGFPSYANHDFAWFEALNFRMERMVTSKYLNVRGPGRLALKLLNRDIEIPYPVGLERDGETLLRSYAPPYFASMREAVEAVAAFKTSDHGIFGPNATPSLSREGKTNPAIAKVSDKAVAATTAYCEYLWKHYGRFPVHMPAFRTVLVFQAGHLDTEFYEKFYPTGTVPQEQPARSEPETRG